jgi:curli biogenesis system outer membrane secretion channel CsgG
MQNRFLILSIALTVLTLAGCASTTAQGPTAAAPAAAAASATSPPSGLAEGVALYNKGDYNGAIKRLGQADVIAGPKAVQLAGLKYSAFSYCVTARQMLCRQQFDKALKIDPAFDLAAGEYGHPLWGPVFVKAKKAVTKQ